jgi:nucleoside-diphosphate-sugar epimerase
LKIFITGVTGYVGSVLANYFIKLGYSVIGTGRSAQLPKHVNSACQYIQQDITKTIAPIDADIVIHAAAITSDSARYDELYDVNLIGTKNVVAACKLVKKFILISTSSVYAFNQNKAYVEAEAGVDFDSLSNYGKTKFLSEKELLQTNQFEQVFILRPRAIYGVGDTALLPRLLKLVKGNKLYLPANTTRTISLTHIDLLVAAVAYCVSNNTNKIDIFNIADPKPYCLRTCIQLLTEAATQKKLTLVLIPKLVWNTLIAFNAVAKVIPELTKFGSRQLTNQAVLDTTVLYKKLGAYTAINFKQISIAVGEWYNNKN